MDGRTAGLAGGLPLSVPTARPGRPEGVIAFPITPSEDGIVDTDALQRLLAPLVATGVASGVDGIGLLGSTGSYPYFSRTERRRAVAAAVECVDGRVPLLVGCGAVSTAAAIEATRDAQEAGADFGLLAAVSYAPLTDDEAVGLFADIARIGLRLCIYDNPRNTQFCVTPEVLTRLAGIDGVVALKSPAPRAQDAAETLAALRRVVPEEFSVGFSVDWHAAAALRAGGDAWYSVLAGLYPRLCLDLARAARSADDAALGSLQRRLEPVWALFRAHGSYRVMHALASRLTGSDHPPPRPVLPLSGEAAREVARVAEGLSAG